MEGGRAQLTNLPWTLVQSELAAATAIEQLELVNDFAVLIYGLPHLQADQQAVVRCGIPVAGAPLLVLGAGTGLGVAYGVPTAAGLVAIASEGSHAEFAPRNAEEWQLKQWLLADLGLERVSIERVVSGTGLGLVARWLLATHPHHPLMALAAAGDQDLPTHHRYGIGRPAGLKSVKQLCHRPVELIDPLDGIDLGELRGDLRVIHRIERVLIVHLGNQQFQKAVGAAVIGGRRSTSGS